jgi:lysozyme
MTIGIDVSHWSGKMDWAKAKAAGVSLGIFKGSDFTSDGKTGFVDIQAENNWKGTRDAGINNGVFCWLQPGADPTVQGRYFLDNVWARYPTNLPPVLDFEDKKVTASGCFTDYLWRAKVWLELVEKETATIPIIYTSKGFMMDFDIKKSGWMNKYPLWLAWYPKIKISRPTAPKPWDSWIIWQYSETGDGRLYGAESTAMDMDEFDEAVIQKLLIAPVNPDVTTPVVTTPVVTDTTNILPELIDAVSAWGLKHNIS